MNQTNALNHRHRFEFRAALACLLASVGGNPFLAYGVVNDGGAPGQRSGDGAYLPGQ